MTVLAFIGLNLFVELTYYRVLMANLLSNLAYRFASQSLPLTHTLRVGCAYKHTHCGTHAHARAYTHKLSLTPTR